MLSLTERIDNKVEINGIEYAIDISFDNVINFFELLEEEIDNVIKVEAGLRMLLKRQLNISFEEKSAVFREIVDKFLLDKVQNKNVDIKGNPMPVSQQKESFSLKYDAELIYAAFRQAYKIDLIEQQGQLEWKKFKALLTGLPSETRFCEVVEIRQRTYPKGKGMEEERAALRKLKQEFSYPGADFT